MQLKCGVLQLVLQGDEFARDEGSLSEVAEEAIFILLRNGWTAEDSCKVCVSVYISEYIYIFI